MTAHTYFANRDSSQRLEPIAISHAGERDLGDHAGSLAAYRRAYDRGCRWFQVDAVAIADEQLLSSHAVFGRRRKWEGLSAREVSRLQDRPLPLVGELYDEFPDAKFNIEIKSRRAETSLRRLMERPGVAERTCISTPFHRGISRRLRRDYGDRICLAAPLLDGGLFGVPLSPVRRIRHDVYQVWFPLARSRRLVQRALRNGIHFQVWTINTDRGVDRCLALGVTGMITDRHEVVRKRLEQAGLWDQ